jgi:hypothetical protein
MLRKPLVGLYFFLVLFLALGLVASCGGGGGGSSSSGGTTYTLSGTVTGAVLQGVTITVSGAGSTTTNTSGAYSIAGLANGYYTVTASKPSYTFSPANQVVAINYANATAANFVSENAYSISGKIADGSAVGIQDVTMTLTGAGLASALTVTTDASGNYLFSGLVTNGTYTLQPSKSEQNCVCGSIMGGCGLTVTQTYGFSPASRSMTVSGSNATSVDFTGTYPAPWRGACPT